MTLAALRLRDHAAELMLDAVRLAEIVEGWQEHGPCVEEYRELLGIALNGAQRSIELSEDATAQDMVVSLAAYGFHAPLGRQQADLEAIRRFRDEQAAFGASLGEMLVHTLWAISLLGQFKAPQMVKICEACGTNTMSTVERAHLILASAPVVSQ